MNIKNNEKEPRKHIRRKKKRDKIIKKEDFRNFNKTKT